MKLIDITGKAISGEWGNDCEDGNGIPVLRTTNFTDAGVINFANVVLRDIPPKDLSKKFLRPGDIIIEKSGGSDTKPVGRVVYFDSEENKYLINNFTGLLRVVDQTKWYPRYVFYALFANYSFGGTRQYENKTTGLHNLKLDQYLNSFDIPDVDFQLQHHIADTLDKVSEGLEVCRRMLGELDLMVKAKFVEMFGEPIANTHSLPLIPLSEIGNWSSGGTPSRSTPAYFEGNIDWYSAGELNTLYLEGSIEKITQDALENSAAKLFSAGSMLVGMYDTAALKMGILKRSSASNQACACIEPNDNIDIVWLYHVLQIMKPHFLEQRRGIRQKNLNLGMIKSFQVPYAPKSEQKLFASFVTKIDKSKLTIQGIRDKMEMEKLALMQEYFG